ncbi:carbohydrate ABC transporter permease [Micromonospora sp. CPCC 206060]|uniref:carbohydrate ABC transporter permease n=1 Tax=Micromonospora sp. CPCC 206060 TaxID=3122406 RepID=UPI002FF420C5
MSRTLLRRLPHLAALTGAAVLFTLPFVWLISASLRPREYVFGTGFLPVPFTLDNYVEAWSAVPLLTWLFNSVVVGIAAAAAVTISSAWVAFGFAYFRFPGRDLLFGLVLATMMLPFAVTMIPTYLIWSELRLTDTQVPLWAGNLFGSAFYIFLLRQFLLSLPREYFEAVGGGPRGQRHRHRADADPLLPRPAALRGGHRHHRPEGLTRWGRRGGDSD